MPGAAVFQANEVAQSQGKIRDGSSRMAQAFPPMKRKPAEDTDVPVPLANDLPLPGV